jgi:hypothetical protein
MRMMKDQKNRSCGRKGINRREIKLENDNILIRKNHLGGCRCSS